MTIPKMCFALLEKSIETKGAFSIEDTPYLGDFLDQISHQRLGIRILLGHQLALHDSAYSNKLINDSGREKEFLQTHSIPSGNNGRNGGNGNGNGHSHSKNKNGKNKYHDKSGTLGGGFHGIFEDNCDFSIYVDKSVQDAREVCQRNFNGIAPNVNIIDKRQIFDCTYVPEMFHHMAFELLKNSMRATIEHCLHRNDLTMGELNHGEAIDIQSQIEKEITGSNSNSSHNKYDINVIIVDDTNGDVYLKIEDKGGGISKSELEKVFLYGYTTAYNNNNNGETTSGRIQSDSDNEQDAPDRSATSREAEGYDSELEEDASNVYRSDLSRQRELYKKILFESEQELDHDWQNVESITSENFMKYVQDEKYLRIHRGVLGALKTAPMSGLGYGLPVVRVGSMYFGGSCKIFTTHGHGTDAYLHCPNLAELKDFKV